MISCGSASGGADGLGAAYERLRHWVVAGAAPGSRDGAPWGLGLVLRAGITGWMAQQAAGATAPAPPRPAVAPLPSGELHAGVVRVLASIALAHRAERSP